MYDEWGIADGYHDVGGEWHATSQATIERLRAAIGKPSHEDPMWFVPLGDSPSLMGPCTIELETGDRLDEVVALPRELPAGYHWLHPVDGASPTRLIVHPSSCREAPTTWGVSAQIYSMWRPDSWGIGDLRDVVALGNAVATLGAGVLLLSPLHAPAATPHQQTSPYYPSSRRWLNPLLIAPTDERPPFVSNTSGGIIDRDAVWRAKRTWLEHRFRTDRGDPTWRSWARAEGHQLWSYATWNALADVHGSMWRSWPDDLRHPASTAVLDLPLVDREHAERCEFHAWCQWFVRGEVARAADAAGLGLIGDLAIGSSPDGADAWMHQDLVALDMRIGAPPDAFNTAGQDWGLPPFIPWRLRAAGYAPFIAMVRSAMQSMAGLRMDHVMGLFRQYWVPEGSGPADGGYVRLPADELLAIICIESHRSGAFVIGEDLGTVEDEVHAAMARTGMLGTKVWWFDTDVDGWPEASLASVTTHDLPTVGGVYDGTDGSAEMRAALVTEAPPDASAHDAAAAVHAAITRSPARLRLAALDDLAGATERPNRPGTYGEGTLNWSVRMSATAEGIVGSTLGTAIVTSLTENH